MKEIPRRGILQGVAAGAALAALGGRGARTAGRLGRRDPITPRCELSGSSGSTSVSSISPALTGWTNAGLGVSGTAPATGDFVVIIGTLNANTAVVSKTAGTGAWTFQSTGDKNGGTNALETFVAWRIFDGTETAPTFSWSTGNVRCDWSMMALAPDSGKTIAVDAWATLLKDTTAATTHTASSGTATAGFGDCSLILGGCIASGNGTSPITFTAPDKWAIPSGASVSNTGGTGTKGIGTSICYRRNRTGTVTPGAETMEGGSSSTGTTQANLYHLLVKEGPAAATFPSILSTSGQNLVDANGHVMPVMRGFCVPVYAATATFAQQDFTDMYNKGARIARVMVYWSQLEPTSGNIDTTWVSTYLDPAISRAVAAGMYVWLGFYFGPNGQKMPTWAQTITPASAMGNYTRNGQNATQYLAKRYGDSSDPLGAGQYTKAVIGMGINEPTPDGTDDWTHNDWIASILTQQVQMATWMRTYAPDWILMLASGFANSALVPNATGSGQTGQTFTAPSTTPTTNFVIDHHNYFEYTDLPSTPDADGRMLDGRKGSDDKQRQDSTVYPPVVGGVTLTTDQLRRMNAAYLATYVEYCDSSHANCPLFIGEYGWDPTLQTDAGISANVADKIYTWENTSCIASVTEWDYATNQGNDPICARPGVGNAGADTDGWQKWTNQWLAGS